MTKSEFGLLKRPSCECGLTTIYKAGTKSVNGKIYRQALSSQVAQMRSRWLPSALGKAYLSPEWFKPRTPEFHYSPHSAMPAHRQKM